MTMDGTIQVWQCVGCGRVEGPAQCIGVCQDRIAEMVDVSALHAANAEIDRLRALLAQIAHTTPRPGQFEGAWRAYQAQALKALGK